MGETIRYLYDLVPSTSQDLFICSCPKLQGNAPVDASPNLNFISNSSHAVLHFLTSTTVSSLDYPRSEQAENSTLASL